MTPAREGPPSAWLLSNLAAEEEDHGPTTAHAPPASAAAARLWWLLFGDGAQLLSASGEPLPAAWPAALGPPSSQPVFEWLESAGGLVPWLATRSASERAAARGTHFAATDPATVARVHDKAFAQRVAARERLVPSSLREQIQVLDADALRDSDAAIRTLDAHLSAWPDWARRSFTLKPRFGSSGRGRVAGRDGCADTPEIRGALPRLAARGGALLEPWLERTHDFSTQIFVPAATGDAVVILGSLALLVTGSGVYRGHRGQVDSRGRIFSGSPRDETLREAAVAVALAAREEGFAGPCGIDAFEFRVPGDDAENRPPFEALRAVVELNARHTLGGVAIGLVRRALPSLKRDLGLAPGMRLELLFALDAPEGGWDAARARAGDDALWIPLGAENDAAEPGLLVSADAEALAALERDVCGR